MIEFLHLIVQQTFIHHVIIQQPFIHACLSCTTGNNSITPAVGLAGGAGAVLASLSSGPAPDADGEPTDTGDTSEDINYGEHPRSAAGGYSGTADPETGQPVPYEGQMQYPPDLGPTPVNTLFPLVIGGEFVAGCTIGGAAGLGLITGPTAEGLDFAVYETARELDAYEVFHVESGESGNDESGNGEWNSYQCWGGNPPSPCAPPEPPEVNVEDLPQVDALGQRIPEVNVEDLPQSQ
jgi:hypothetical protein